jgi:hypothetical protein
MKPIDMSSMQQDGMISINRLLLKAAQPEKSVPPQLTTVNSSRHGLPISRGLWHDGGNFLLEMDHHDFNDAPPNPGDCAEHCPPGHGRSHMGRTEACACQRCRRPSNPDPDQPRLRV